MKIKCLKTCFFEARYFKEGKEYESNMKEWSRMKAEGADVYFKKFADTPKRKKE